MRQFHYSRINIYASPITKVIFHKFKQGGDIIALFPEQLNQSNMMIGSYMHVGQHSDADYNGVIATTTPATEGEYIELMSELKRMGYDELQVMEAQQLLIERIDKLFAQYQSDNTQEPHYTYCRVVFQDNQVGADVTMKLSLDGDDAHDDKIFIAVR